MIRISTEFLSGPKPDVDYGKLVARVPQLRALNDNLDEMLFKMAGGVFLCLIDDRRVNPAGKRKRRSKVHSLCGLADKRGSINEEIQSSR